MDKTTQDKQIIVFLSSPRIGLEAERAFLLAKEPQIKAALSAMEVFMASPETPKELCLRKLRDARIVISLIGSNYGSIDPESGHSFSEVEYDEAKDLGIDIFVFGKSEDKTSLIPMKEETKEIADKHAMFRQKLLKERHINFFINKEELLDNIIKSINEYTAEIISKIYSPLVDYKEYFNASLREDSLFTHNQALVGRKEEIAKIIEFVSSDKKILSIVGRGGIGKSKILYEAAKQLKTERILFIRGEINDALKEIPSGRIVLILDDAHKYDELNNVIALFQNSDLRDRIKLILSYRQSGKEQVKMLLLSSVDIALIDELLVPDLKQEDIKTIVDNIIQNEFNDQIKSLISSYSKDSPFVAVLGSKYVLKKRINPAIIKNDAEFRDAVLARYYDDISKVIKEHKVPDSLLEYIAILSPIRPVDSRLINILSDKLKVGEDEVQKDLSIIEENGLLLRRGRLARLEPDILSDYILQRVCYTNDDRTKRFIKDTFNIFSSFRNQYLSNILANLAEIEWGYNLQHDSKIDLLGPIWTLIKQAFNDSPNYLRVEIIENIEKAAIYQPRYVLEIINIAYRNPSGVAPKGPYAKVLSQVGHADVLNKLPKLLGIIAHHSEYFIDCCKILWNLSKTDKRELNPYPDHPIRILQDLASYGDKPAIFNVKMVEFIKELLKEKAIFKYKYNPFDFLDSLLAKEVRVVRSKPGAIMIGSKGLNLKVIAGIRKDVLQIYSDHLDPSVPPNITTKTLNSLCKALAYVPSSFGRIISKEEEEQWLPEQLEILRVISEGIKRISSAAFNVMVKKDLIWYQQHGRHKPLQDKISELFNSIPEDYTFRLFRAVYGNYESFFRLGEDWETTEKKVDQEINEVVKLIVEHEKDAKLIYLSLINAINEWHGYVNGQINPAHLLINLSNNYADISFAMLKLIIHNPNNSLTAYCSSLIWPIPKKLHDKQLILKTLQAGMRTRNILLCKNIAEAYRYIVEGFTPQDFDNFKFLIDLNNDSIVPTIISALTTLGKTNSDSARKLALMIRIKENNADHFCGIFDNNYGVPYETLQDKDIKSILSRLIPLDIFRREDYHVDRLLEYIARNHLGLALSFLFDRMTYSRKVRPRTKDYTPLPYLGFHYAFQNISKQPGYAEHVRRVREIALAAKGMDYFWHPRLFSIVSDSYSKESISILEEWLISKERKKIKAVAMLIKEAPSEFLFSNSEFVGKLISAADQVSKDCLMNVSSELFAIAISDTRVRDFGHPSQKSIMLKEKGEEISKTFSPSHPANKFFVDIVDYANKQIKEELESDEEESLTYE